LTALGRVFGTPWYMAPEQAAGETIDARADLYAVGAMMFEMLTGQPPFDGDTLAAVLHKHMFAELPALPEWLPQPIAAFVRALLEKRPADRPANATTASKMLRDAVAHTHAQPTIVPLLTIGNVTIDPERPVSMLRSSQRQGRVMGAMAAIAAAVLLAFGVQHVVRGDEEPAAAPVTTIAAATPTTTTTAPTIAPTPTANPTVKPTVKPTVTPVVATVTPTPAPTHEVPRSTGAHTTTHKPASKPASKPATKHPNEGGVRKLEPSRPPRHDSGKLPGAHAPSTLSRDGGKLHLRPVHG
jgi:serine/threonine-protein kinase